MAEWWGCGDGDRGLLLGAERLGSGLMHFNNVRRMDDLDARILELMFSALSLEGFFVTYEKDFFNL